MSQTLYNNSFIIRHFYCKKTLTLHFNSKHLALHYHMSFNRTFMELKYNYCESGIWFGGGFNRTFMELKSNGKPLIRSSFCGFNRTFMELKYDPREAYKAVRHVLIVPLWN